MTGRFQRRCRGWAGTSAWLVMGVACALLPGSAHAAQEFQGLCAIVKMEIQQELTLERIGFLATLEITNNEGDANITDFSASSASRPSRPTSTATRRTRRISSSCSHLN